MNKSDLIANHILAHLGPQRALPLDWLVFLSVIYIVILVSGLIGNFITILVIFRFRYMQTITNLYLCNLAITDLISLMLSKYSICWNPNQTNQLSHKQTNHKLFPTKIFPKKWTQLFIQESSFLINFSKLKKTLNSKQIIFFSKSDF